MLRNLSEETLASPINVENYVCPLCGHKYDALNAQDELIRQSSDWLDNELKITELYTSDFSEEIRLFEREKQKVIDQIKKVWKQKKRNRRKIYYI